MVDHQAAELFVAIAETGSLAAAARRQGISPSMVSRRISKLEEELQVQLLNRSTRSLVLTEMGRMFLDWAHETLEQRAQLFTRMRTLQEVPEGRIRIAIDGLVAASYLPEVMQQFSSQYPRISVDVETCSYPPAYLDGRCDLAIHAGTMPADDLIGRRAYEYDRRTVAAPAYIAAHGAPREPQELRRHRCLSYASPHAPDWLFRASDGTTVSVRIDPYVKTNSWFLLRSMAVNGMGIARIGRPVAEADMRDGLLVPVLEGYDAVNPEGTRLGVWIVHAERRPLLRVKLFSGFIARYLRATISVEERPGPPMAGDSGAAEG